MIPHLSNGPPASRSSASPNPVRRVTPRRRRLEIVVGAALCVPTFGAPALAGTLDSAVRSERVGDIERNDQTVVRQFLIDWFASFDTAISALSESSDHVAGRALRGAISELAVGEDRRMNRTAEALLSESWTSTQRAIEFNALTPPSPNVVRIEAPAVSAPRSAAVKGADPSSVPAAPARR